MSHGENAGAIMCNSQTLIVINCYFYNNSNLNGGAIYFNKYVSSDAQYMIIEKTLFVKNEAGEAGSAIYFGTNMQYILGNITNCFFFQQYSFYGKYYSFLINYLKISLFKWRLP